SGSPVTFTASATPGKPAAIAIVSGNNQSAAPNSTLPIAPAVRVADRLNDSLPGVGVTFSVVSGGGSVTGGAATTDIHGIATVGSWTLGSSPGPNTLTATVNGVSFAGNPVTINATAVTAQLVTWVGGDAGGATNWFNAANW